MVNQLSRRLDITEQWVAARLIRWAQCESPSSHADAVNRMQDLVLAEMAGEGAIDIERVPGRDGVGDIVVLRSGRASAGGTFLLGHVDTVHPIGTAAEKLPIRREGDRLYGPGLYDMKGGVLCAILALVDHARRGNLAPVTYLLSPDEEIGSPTTRALIESLAVGMTRTLVLEPARSCGAAVTARKGVGWFDFRIEGIPAHAGTHHADGRSAIREACHQILQLEHMTDYALGTTVSVGEISGGSARNVIPAQCTFSADIRVKTTAEAERIENALTVLQAADPLTTIRKSGGFNRPPYEKTAGTAALLEEAVRLALPLGIELRDVPMVGGGSDGNFTAALGVPTLDGLGVQGAGAHTWEEHCLLSSVLPRAALIAALCDC
jgi:glutamate carboxypeptidase